MTDRVLQTERLVLRPPAARDMVAGVAFYMSERSQFAGGHVMRHHAWKNMAAMLGHWQVRGYGLWAVTRKDDDHILGLVGPYNPEGWPEPEVGWLIFDGAEGQGIAAEAARSAMADARATLGWTDIVHYIAPQNTRSIALAERLGARRDPAAQVPKPDTPCLVFRNLAQAEAT